MAELSRAAVGLVGAVAEGYVAPRRSMRRLLDAGHGLETSLTMLALAYLIEAILAVPFGASATGIGGHFVNAIQLVFMFFLLSGVIWGIGRLASGRGTMEGAQLVVGWHALVTSPLSPLAIAVASATFRARAGGDPSVSGGVMLLAFLYIGVSFWLMASYVAELHQFRSTWAVLGALVGLTFAAAILLTSVLGALSQP